MAIDRSLIVVLSEPDGRRKRVVKVGFIPFTIGTSPDADVRIEKSERRIELRVVQSEGRFRIIRDADHDFDADRGSAETARGAWLHNGMNLHFGGVYFRFFTHLAPDACLDARNANVEIITAPRRRNTAAKLMHRRARKQRQHVGPYVPAALDAPPSRDQSAVPHVPKGIDGPAYLQRLENLEARLTAARSRPETRRR